MRKNAKYNLSFELVRTVIQIYSISSKFLIK